MSPVTHEQESFHRNECVISQKRMLHVTHMNTSRHIFERIMSHNVMCHVIFMSASRGAERAHRDAHGNLAPPAPPPPRTRRHTLSLSHPCSLARSLTSLPHPRSLLACFLASSLAPLLPCSLAFFFASIDRSIAHCRVQGAAGCGTLQRAIERSPCNLQEMVTSQMVNPPLSYYYHCYHH